MTSDNTTRLELSRLFWHATIVCLKYFDFTKWTFLFVDLEL